MQSPNLDDKIRLVEQWQADADSLRAMANDMQREIVKMRKAKEPSGHIQFRQAMITQYESTISKLEALVKENE